MTRSEFEQILKSIYYPLVFDNNYSCFFDCFSSLFTNSQSGDYTILTRFLRAQGRIAFYLAQWDAAPDQPSKEAVLGTVDSLLGNASVDPSSAIMPASSGGLFPRLSELSTVATTGSYNDLSNKPTIPAAQIQSDWAQGSSGALDFIKNKPSLSFSTPTFSSVTTATQLSATRAAQVIYTFPTSMTSILANQTLSATLQFADDAAFTTNVVSPNSDNQGCSGLLNLTLSGRLQVQGTIPAGKYRRVVLAQTGGATVPTTLASGQEVLQ